MGFSIIICTHNPDLRLLDRLLKAILNFSIESPKYEVIIIDNNSDNQLSDITLVKQFLTSRIDAYILRETTPGLTAARIRGIKAAKYDWLIFFDDDNEPQADYLFAAEKSINMYPKVGVWGPGVVDVEYIGKVNAWLRRRKTYFQQRNEDQVRYSASLHWKSEYPYGTGMILQKEIAVAYALFVQKKKYMLSDRKGKELSSGGDVQLVFTCIAMGKAAGINPEIKIRHLILPSKTSFCYLKKLVYGTASSYLMAFNEVYPEQRIPFSSTSNHLVMRLFWFYIRQYQKNLDWRTAVLSFINRLGEINSMYLAHGDRQKPFTLRFFERLLV